MTIGQDDNPQLPDAVGKAIASLREATGQVDILLAVEEADQFSAKEGERQRLLKNLFEAEILKSLAGYDASEFVLQRYARFQKERQKQNGNQDALVDRTKFDFERLRDKLISEVREQIASPGPLGEHKIDESGIHSPRLASAVASWFAGQVRRPAKSNRAPLAKEHDRLVSCADEFLSKHSELPSVLAFHEAAKRLRECWDEFYKQVENNPASYKTRGTEPGNLPSPLETAREINDRLLEIEKWMFGRLASVFKVAAEAIYTRTGRQQVARRNSQPFANANFLKSHFEDFYLAFADDIAPNLRNGWVLEQCILGGLAEIILPGPIDAFCTAEVISDIGKLQYLSSISLPGGHWSHD